MRKNLVVPPRLTPDGAAITTWKWMRAMVEHEAHHRGQIYIYLAMLEVPTPPLKALSEQVAELSAKGYRHHKGLRRLYKDDDARGVLREHTIKLRDILVKT
jgi:DinB family